MKKNMFHIDSIRGGQDYVIITSDIDGNHSGRD